MKGQLTGWVYMGACGLRGYLWSTWVLVVYVGTCGLGGYLWSTWVLVVYVGGFLSFLPIQYSCLL